MNLERQSALLGLIYDSVFDPDLIVPVMERLAVEVGGETACVTTLDTFTGEGGGYTALVPDGTMATYVAHWAHDNPLREVEDPLAYTTSWRPHIIRYEEWIDREQLHRSGYWNEFLRPIGAENGIMMGLALTGTTLTTMNIARSARRGIFEDEEIARAWHWQAHLSRAERMARQVRITQASLDAIDQLLATTTQRLFLLDMRGCVRRMSAAAEAMLATGAMLRIADGKLVALPPNDDGRLKRLVEAANGRVGGMRQGGSMTLQAADGAPRELTVAPLGPRSAATWSTEPVVMVTVATAGAPPLPTALMIRQRFGLTPAEARLALALADGGTLREVADAAKLSINTVRAQLGTVFSKTGCRRQADLVRTLLAMSGGEE